MSEPWHPHAGQKKAVKFLLEHACAALFADPGTGKTSAVYAAFKMLKKRGLAEKMLVVAPLKPCWLVWPLEQQKWADFTDLRVEVLHGSKKDAALHRDADVYVVNPEGLDWLIGAVRTKSARGKLSLTADLKTFKSYGFDTLVVDELTCVKHTSSGRHKALKQIRGTFARVWGLTGTPTPNGLLDLFGQALILDGGRSLGPYITHYRNSFFLPSYDGFSWVLRKGADEEIYERIRPLALRLAAKDYVDMPEMVENVLKFDLPPDVRRIYDELEEDLISRIEENILEAPNAAAASTKCRQVASGGIYLDDVSPGGPVENLLSKRIKASGGKGREWLDLHDEKTDLVSDLVEELQGAPLLIAYDFRHDLARLQRRLGKDVPYIGGGTPAKRAIELEAAWNRGELPVLLGHPLSMGHGLNLQKAGNHVCFYSTPWALDVRDQLVGRVARQGSAHKRVFVHYLTARKTVDETILVALRNKSTGQAALLDALRNIRKARK